MNNTHTLSTDKRSPVLALAAISLLGLGGAWIPVAEAGAPPAQAPRTPRQAAPIDLTGNWVAVITEDWRFRMLTPSKGDYASVPLTDAARQVADNWDPERDRAEGNACRAYGVANLLRMPTRLRINWADDNTLKIETDAGRQVRNLNFVSANVVVVRQELNNATGGGAQAVRPDARNPVEESQAVSNAAFAAAMSGPRTLQGVSRAEWERSNLKVTTTHHIGGYLRRNGVPYSEDAAVTEYFYRYEAFGDEWLTVSTVVEDPLYLRQPFLTSSSFKKEADGSKWAPADCVSEWGPLRQMGVDPFD